MLGLNVVAAESDREARHLSTSRQQAFVSLRRGRPTPLPPPDDSFEQRMTPFEHAMLEAASTCSIAGSADTVRRWVTAFVERTGADELMVSSQIFDHAAHAASAVPLRDALVTHGFQAAVSDRVFRRGAEI